MKYFYKLLLSMVLMLTAALAIMEYSSVAFSLEHSFRRERDSELIEHQLVKHAIQSAILNANDDGFISSKELDLIGENASKLLKASGGLFLSDAENHVYHNSLSTKSNHVTTIEGETSYQVIRGESEKVLLRVKSKFIQDDRELILMTEQDISPVFVEAETLWAQCTRLYFAVLGVCVIVGLVLAIALTRPLTVLSAASKAFTAGNYGARAHLKTHDEVGELADTYNKMAETIEEKINQLEEANQRQERFTANFAHELKTPMTSIIGYADTIYQKDLSTEEMRQAAWYIMNEGMRLEALSFKLMDLLTLNQTEFILEETEITDLLKDVEATAAPLAQKRSVEFICDFENSWVRLEYDLFKTLLLNLIDNALKSGGSRVLLTSRVDGEECHISISDNGRGISPEEITRITEAFYMVDKSRSRKEHGAGLGLALCSRIAEIHGTKLNYVSNPSEGTTVSITLRREVGGDESQSFS